MPYERAHRNNEGVCFSSEPSIKGTLSSIEEIEAELRWFLKYLYRMPLISLTYSNYKKLIQLIKFHNVLIYTTTPGIK